MVTLVLIKIDQATHPLYRPKGRFVNIPTRIVGMGIHNRIDRKTKYDKVDYRPNKLKCISHIGLSFLNAPTVLPTLTIFAAPRTLCNGVPVADDPQVDLRILCFTIYTLVVVVKVKPNTMLSDAR